jgi:hypothetical protein
VEQGENNNKQLLNLLEKYDYKLDELQEDNELKDMKIFQYERDYLKDKPKIKIESIEEKVRFLVQVLHRLKCMYLEGVTAVYEQRSSNVSAKEISYPYIPPGEYSNSEVLSSSLPIDEAADKTILAMGIIEANRQIRVEQEDKVAAHREASV